MKKRISALGTPDEWAKRYKSWVRSHLDCTSAPDEAPVSFVAPEFSPEELTELELELMCDELAGRSTDETHEQSFKVD